MAAPNSSFREHEPDGLETGPEQPDALLAADPFAEMRELVEALSAHAARRRRLGVRSAPAIAESGSFAPPNEPRHETRHEPTHAPGLARPSLAPPPEAPARAAALANPLPEPARRPIPRASPTPPPGPRPNAGVASSPGVASALAEARERAERNRAEAAACADLDSLRRAVAACTACDLCRTRKQTVFADGDGSAGVLFVGEAPGADEDDQGVPFVGAAGKLLTDIVQKGMGLPRSKVAIANVLKCRPPGNRDPTDAEKLMCTPWLDRQMELMAPRMVIALGRHAANHVLGYAGAARQSMGALRGKVFERGGRKVVATYHPSYLLRSPHEKKECWKDIQVAMRELGLEPPRRSS